MLRKNGADKLSPHLDGNGISGIIPAVMGADIKLLSIDSQIAKLREDLEKTGANVQQIQDKLDALTTARTLRIAEIAQVPLRAGELRG